MDELQETSHTYEKIYIGKDYFNYSLIGGKNAEM